jgi:hypothetical protein
VSRCSTSPFRDKAREEKRIRRCGDISGKAKEEKDSVLELKTLRIYGENSHDVVPVPESAEVVVGENG